MAKERRGKRESPLADTMNTARPGEYVIMVEDMTSAPFMGHILQSAFKLIRILPEKAKGKNNRKFGMLSVPNS